MSLDQIELETSGKWERLKKEEAIAKLESIKDVKQYLAKLSPKDSASRLANPEIQKQITAFLEKSANNALSKNLEKFNAKKFDTDGEKGLDTYEFERFSEAMKWAIAQIVALDGMWAFERVHNESQETGWTTPDKLIAGWIDIWKHILWEKWSASFTEEIMKKVGTISPEEFHKMSEKPFSLSIEGCKDMAILLAKELGSGVEDMVRFLTNIPAWLILLPRYLSYRVDSNSSDIQKKTEWDIKLTELVESNSSLGIVELLGEKWIAMIGHLASMMKSGKQGDIATLLVTIAGLLAGGAGAVKVASSMARKSAVRVAREAGSVGRTVEWRAMRNTLKDVSKTAEEVAKVAGKVDSIVSGNAAIGKLTKVVAGGVKKVAPSMWSAANDAGNMSELERARATKEAKKIADAVGTMEMQGTGTHGPATWPRMSANPYGSKSTKRLREEQAYAKSGVDPMEVLKNARLGDAERIEKAEQILGRTLDMWEQLAIEHIHKNISKWIYTNNSGDLQKMYDAWESMTHHKRTTDIAQNKTQYAEFRKLVENGILWTDANILTSTHTPSAWKVPEATKPSHDAFHNPEITAETERILGEINKKWDIEFIEKLLSGKPIHQAYLNTLVHEYSKTHGLDPVKLDIFIKDIFEISGYVGNQSDMYAHAIAFSKEKTMRWLLWNLTNISARDMIAHVSEWIEASGELLKAFLKNGSPHEKESFLQLLIGNDALRVNILGSNKAEDLLRVISENTQNRGALVATIINDQTLMKKMAPEHLKTMDTIVEKMVKENWLNGWLIEIFRTKLALARDAKSPKNRIANFLQNGDDNTAKLLWVPFSSERLAWNMIFEDYRLVDNGNTKQLNMLIRWEANFFHTFTLGNFFNLSFWDLEKSIQKEFIEKYVSPPGGKYHSLLEEFPRFQKELQNQGMI